MRLLHFVKEVFNRCTPSSIMMWMQSAEVSRTDGPCAHQTPYLRQGQDNSSRSLLGLPAELRAQIWTFVFALDYDMHSRDNEMDLFTTRSPNNAILSVSRQVHDETKDLYEQARNKFWSSKFEILLPSSNWTDTELSEVRSQLSMIPDEYIKRITQLSIRRPANLHNSITLTFDKGAWSWQREACPLTPPTRWAVFVPQIDPSLRLPPHCRLRMKVFDDDPPYPVLTFLQFHGGIEVDEAHQIAGWNGLSKREIIGAVRWYQEWS